MRKSSLRLLFDGAAHEGAIRLLSDRLDFQTLQEGQTVTVNLARVMSFKDPFYGKVDLTKQKFQKMIKNFSDNVYGQKVFIDVAHTPSDGAAAEIKRMYLDGLKFMADAAFTPFGVKAVTDRGFRYLSIDFTEEYTDPESGKDYGPLLFGAGLTIRPRVKRLDPVTLSQDDDDLPYLLNLKAKKILLSEVNIMFEEFLKQLRKQLSECKLSDNLAGQFITQFETTGKALGDNKEGLEALVEVMTANAKALAETGKGDSETIKLDFSGLKVESGKKLGEDDIRRILAEEEKKRTDANKKLAEDKQAHIDLFKRMLDEAEGLKSLSEDQSKELGEAVDLITAEMSQDQVKQLAEHQIKIGNRMAVSRQLGNMGFAGPQGTVHISLDESNNVKQSQETIDRRLGLLDMSESRRYAKTDGKLQDDNKQFAEKVLALYDRMHAAQLAKEHKMLAAGDGVVSDISVPSLWERTVIRESLYQLMGLQFVNVGVEQFSTSYSIPYSYRDTNAAGRGNTRVYEGGSVPRAGVIQTAETAYNIPQKLSFEVSDELRYLTQGGPLNWDALLENQQNASRIVGEDLEQLIFNELLHAADEYGATAVSNENLELQADDVKNIFVLAHFPVVRPRAVYDLQGNQVGSTSNPITVTYNSVALAEYDGTGTQSPGTYYVLDYNLGEIYLVNQAGAIQVPANATAYTISYNYATNVYNFDTDLGSNTAEVHWDDYLYRYGLRKTIIEDDRYYMANFGVMSGTHMTQVEQAKKFAANSKRPGTDLMTDGNLGRVKDIANFKTSAPGLWMGDQRAIIGERGTTRVRMTKPWTLGELQDQKDANGRFTGKKEAYGDQFVVVHTPTQLKRAYTSINLYSATARVARTA